MPVLAKLAHLVATSVFTPEMAMKKMCLNLSTLVRTNFAKKLCAGRCVSTNLPLIGTLSDSSIKPSTCRRVALSSWFLTLPGAVQGSDIVDQS